MPIIEDAGQYGWSFEPLNAQSSSAGQENYPWLVNKAKIETNRVLAADDQLCENCNQLDFTVLFRMVLSETSFKWAGIGVYLTHGIKLGSLDQIKSKRNCSFCHLVWQTISSDPKTPIRHFDVWLNNFAISNDGKICLRTHQERRGPAIVQVEISIRERQSFTASPRSAFRIQVKPESQLADVKSNKFWPLLKWLDSCEESYGKGSLMRGEASYVDIHERLELFSRVIDVRRRRIVKAPKRCRYVALSYVWGGRNFALLTSKMEKRFEQDGSIDLMKFPNTILDALLLCRDLGERYLWVDSMCITQDTEDKHNHIKAMEAIYRGATLTLVAAAGGHAHVGLPGLSAEPFGFQQKVVAVQGLILVNVSPDFETCVDSSDWNTRAWTYQERLLSRRLAIFTKDQIYFQCDHGRAQGDSGLDPHDSKYLQYLESQDLDSGDAENNETYRLEMKRKVNLNIYAQMVKEYSSRKLSYASDIENAFGGINKIVHLLFGGSEILFGLPISGLALGLLWSSKASLTRRPSSFSTDMTRPNASQTSRDSYIFPSWSWIGWIGPVEFAEIKNLSERTISKVSWLDPLNKLKELPQEKFAAPLADWSGRGRWMRQVIPGDHVYYTQKGGDRHHWFCHPMEPFIHDPIPINRDTGSLNLCGSVAEHTLSVVASKKGSKDARYLSVLDLKGAQAGVIILDESSSYYGTPTPSILLRISQTTLKEGRDDPAWGMSIAAYSGKPGVLTTNSIINTSGAEELFDVKIYNPKICWCLYNVLMLKADPQGRLSRIGIGKVHIHAFDKVAKENQVIELC